MLNRRWIAHAERHDPRIARQARVEHVGEPVSEVLLLLHAVNHDRQQRDRLPPFVGRSWWHRPEEERGDEPQEEAPDDRCM